jgi:DNA-binding winged helix-turn-helix (wHTH) protein
MALGECGVVRRDFSRRSKSMTSNIRREMDSLGKRPLSIVIIVPRMEPCVRSLVEPRETVLRVGSLELDLIDRTARRGCRRIDLRPREFQLLKYMMERSDQVLTCANLIKDVWHLNFVPETNRVNVHMGRLRSKVDGPNEVPMIRNVRGEGFVLRTTPALSKSLPGRNGGSSGESSLKRILTTSNVRGRSVSANVSSRTHERLFPSDSNARAASRGVRRRSDARIDGPA